MVITVAAVLLANHAVVQELVTTYIPIVDRLTPEFVGGTRLWWALALTVLTVLGALSPIVTHRQRRSIDTVMLSLKGVTIAMITLAAIGYFKWSIRLPRGTLIALSIVLAIAIPIWFLFVSTRPRTDRVLIVGANPLEIDRAAHAAAHDVIGYLSPRSALRYDVRTAVKHGNRPITDGGGLIERVPTESGSWFGGLEANIDRLGGISRLEDVLIDRDIDTVVVAFSESDRGEFFGALEVCHERGIRAIVHEEHADEVLIAGDYGEGFVEVDIEPWSWWDSLGKRALDVAFSGAALLALSPMLVLIAVAIKLDSSGPVLYAQRRTAGFGRTFPVYKFRTMLPDSETIDPLDDHENDRITRVGRVLRKTNLDEIPQLWSILIGEMSVVGPRATWVKEEEQIVYEVSGWQKRWFVPPGLTGLAQVNEVNSTEPERKLRYDIEYIRRQSLSFDIWLILRQFLNVGRDVLGLFVGEEETNESKANLRND
ncbi:sugar transferase [Natronorarus salvus]|uniref:sugar transferase n=1 Tax=Natronorarus salvus TaxID=3117733 RepID=UPI002F2613BF